MEIFERAVNELKTHRVNWADYVSVEEAAEILQRSIRTLRYWEKAGKMPPRKRFRKKLMYRKQDLQELALSAGTNDA